MLEEWDLDIMARINAQNDEKDRENAERAAASKIPGCAPDPRHARSHARARGSCFFAQRFVGATLRSTTPVERNVVVVSSASGTGGFGTGAGGCEARADGERRKLDPSRVPAFW